MDQEEGFEARNRNQSADQDGESEPEQLPETVTVFLRSLEEHIKRAHPDEVYELYEQQFNKLTDRYFMKARWPHVEVVQQYITDEFTLLLYKEMYYRHIYSRLQPTLQDRIESWENYVAVLQFILADMSGPCKIDLPGQWIWDLLDELVYQFQTFTTFRNKAIKSNSDDKTVIEALKANMGMWDTVEVYRLLHSLAKESGVNDYLSLTEEQRAGQPTTSKLMFGYFAITQILRMECLHGDYHMALKAIEKVEFSVTAMYHKVPACNTTMHYYTGVSYLMLRRYQDAAKTFSSVLIHLGRARLAFSLSYQQEQIQKKTEQMNSLLLISNALSPIRLDESLLQHIKDSPKHYEKQQKLQKGDELAFEELFSYSCPKFISPTPPDWDALETFNPNEGLQRQVKLFLQEVKQQQKFPEIRAYMRLYSAMPIAKLSQFLDVDEESLRTLLMCYKYKTRQTIKTNTGGSPLDGTAVNCSDINYSLDGAMMHMVAQNAQKQYMDVFLQNIVKFQDIIKTIEGKPVSA